MCLIIWRLLAWSEERHTVCDLAFVFPYFIDCLLRGHVIDNNIKFFYFLRFAKMAEKGKRELPSQLKQLLALDVKLSKDVMEAVNRF